MDVFLGGCYADKGCLPQMEENREDLVEPRLNKRDLRFLYGWAPPHENMFGQHVWQKGKYLNIGPSGVRAPAQRSGH